MTSILDHKLPKRWSFPIKTEVKWVLGVYIYICVCVYVYVYRMYTCFLRVCVRINVTCTRCIQTKSSLKKKNGALRGSHPHWRIGWHKYDYEYLRRNCKMSCIELLNGPFITTHHSCPQPSSYTWLCRKRAVHCCLAAPSPKPK